MIKDILFLTYLFADAWKRVPQMVVKTQFFHLLSAVWSSAIGFTVFATFYILEKGSITILGRTVETGKSDVVFLIMFILLGLALCAQSVFLYLENATLNRLCRIYEEKNVARAIARIQNMSVGDIASLPGRLDRPSALRAMQADARITANTQRQLQRVPVPLGMMIFGIVVLGHINPVALIAVFLFTIAATIPFILLSRRALEISHSFEQSAARLTNTKRTWLDRIIMESGHDSGDYTDAHIRELVSHTSMREFMSLFEARVNILSQSSAIGGLIASVTVAIVTAIFAWQALKGNMAWSFVILHFVSLQYIFRAVSRVTGLAVSANRFRAQIQRYFAFISNGRPADTGKVDPTAKSGAGSILQPLQTTITQNAGQTQTFTIEKGQRTFIIGNLPIDRFEVYRFVLALGYQQNPNLHFLDRPHFATLKRIEAADTAESVELDDAARSGLEMVLGPGCDCDSLTARYVWLVLREADRSSGVLFVDQRGMLLLDLDQASRLFDLLKNLHVFVFAVRNVSQWRTWGIETALLFDGTRIRALLDVNDFLENQEENMGLLRPDGSSGIIEEDDDLSNPGIDI